MRGTFTILISILLLTSCSKYEKLLKSTDYEQKYEMAITLYNSGDYFRAQQLFDQLISVFRGTEKAQKVNYYYAYCYYGLGDNLLASYYFKLFYTTYPKSEFAEQSMYMSAYCFYLDSPDYSLDQTNTYKAINELQLFINAYPNSPKVEECNKLIDQLRLKLETKAVEIARLYFRTREYKAAIVAFNNAIKDFPSTRYAEEIYFMIMKSNYLLAVNSIESLKEVRLKSTLQAYDNFAMYYPESKYMKESKSMLNETKRLIENRQPQIN